MNISESTVTLPTATGPMQVAVFRPTTGRWPGVVLYSEIFQLTAPIRRTCAVLAGHGFVIAAPEVYHELEAPGSVLGYTPEGSARGNAHKVAKELSSYDSDAASCIDFLVGDAGCTGAVGTFGMCLGGHLAFRAALDRRVRAAACFYPTDLHQGSLGRCRPEAAGGRTGDDTLARCGEIVGELLLVFGRQDPHIPLAGRRTIQAALEAAARNYTWHEFNAAHAFLRDEGNRYDPQLQRLGLELVLDCFQRRLHG